MSNEITKKDLRRCLWRHIFTRQAPFNYETMQSGGWVYSMDPVMQKLYGDNPDLLAEKYKEHFKFYNTHSWISNIILGAGLAIESTKTEDCTRQAVEMRTALMGPLAGIGDSIIWIMFMTIFGGIAGYMALDGSIMGWVIAEIVQMIVWITFYKLFYVGYKQGMSFVTERSQQMKNITDAIAVLGLAVVGALIASIVNVHLGVTFSIGEITQSLDDLLNSIVPCFANIATVGIIYWALGRKNMNASRLVWIVLVVGIVLGAFNILA